MTCHPSVPRGDDQALVRPHPAAPEQGVLPPSTQGDTEEKGRGHAESITTEL